MISEKGPAFNSKILLFGEYSLIKGSMALSIPNNKLSGQLLFDASSKNQRSNHYSLVYLLEYLDFLENNDFTDLLNISEFKTDIENGLYFECNIPISYGLGSSGAIVASIFDAYSLVEKVDDFSELKSIFSRMESFYHGKSSGLDPLVSYLNKAILLDENGDIKTVEIPNPKKQKKGGIFLLDTKITGETQPLVNWFLKEYENNEYNNKIQNQLIPLNNRSINNFLKGDFNSLLENVKSISEFTFENFKPMIPASVQNIWKDGLENNNYYLKLCGSGGGGMMLGFTEDLGKALSEFESIETSKLTNY
jgi:mevalonate kinase